MARIETVEALREIYGEPSEGARNKVIDRIDAHCAKLISASPMLFMATGDGAKLDVSPKGDAPGFVQVESERALLVPDWPGNSRIDGMRNLLADPRVGLIFVIPGLRETLRVNGTAAIHDDEDLRARFETRGRLPLTVMRVTVRTAFMHCAKAFIRSRLWDPESWPTAPRCRAWPTS